MIKKRSQRDKRKRSATSHKDHASERKVLSKKAIFGGVSAVVSITAASVALLNFYVPTNDPQVTLNIIRVSGSLGISTGGLFGLYLAARKQRSTELDLVEKSRSNNVQQESLKHQIEQAKESNERERRVAEENRHDALEQRVTDLYSNAAEQLDSENLTVRLAGLYTLERLAQHHPDHRTTVVNLICGYLRDPYVPPKRIHDRKYSHFDSLDSDPDEGEVSRERELEVRKTAQRLLRTHLRPKPKATDEILSYFDEGTPSKDDDVDDNQGSDYWGPHDLDLSGASLVDMDLSGCQIKSATFDGTIFFGDTDITFAEILDEATFRRCKFHGRARFSESYFGGLLTLKGIRFESHPVDFSKVKIGGNAIFQKLDVVSPSFTINNPDGTPLDISPIRMRDARFRRHPFMTEFSTPQGWEVVMPSGDDTRKIVGYSGEWGFITPSNNTPQE